MQGLGSSVAKSRLKRRRGISSSYREGLQGLVHIYMMRATLERIDSECSPRGVEVGRLRRPLVWCVLTSWRDEHG